MTKFPALNGLAMFIIILTASGWHRPACAVPVQPPTPVASWLFDEGAGGTASPHTGTVAGVLEGDATWFSNVPLSYAGNSAISFDGTGDYVTMGTDGLLEIGEQLTVSAWVQTATINSAGAIVARAGGSTNKFYLLSVAAGGAVTATTFNGGVGAAGTAADAGTLTVGAWHHLAYTYDGQFGRLYIDGLLKDISDEFIRSGPQVGSALFQVAARNNGNNFRGAIDEVALWDSALSADQIEHLATYGLNFMQTLPQPAPIPEPASLTLAFGALSWLHLRRRKKLARIDGSVSGRCQSQTRCLR